MDGTGDCTADLGSTAECELLLSDICKSGGVADGYEHATSKGCSNCGSGDVSSVQSLCSWSCSYCKSSNEKTVTATVATTTTVENICKKIVTFLTTNSVTKYVFQYYLYVSMYITDMFFILME